MRKMIIPHELSANDNGIKSASTGHAEEQTLAM